MEKATEDAKAKGLLMQELLLQRIEGNESHVKDFEVRLKDNERTVGLMCDQME